MSCTLAKLLAKPVDALDQAERLALRAYYLATANEPNAQQLAKLRAAREKVTQLLDGKTEIMVMEEMKVKPRSTFVLNRGVYNLSLIHI